MVSVIGISEFSEQVKVVIGNALKFETADWLAMYSDRTSHIALLVKHLTEWNRDDCNSVDWVCVGISVRPLESNEVADF